MTLQATAPRRPPTAQPKLLQTLQRLADNAPAPCTTVYSPSIARR